MLAIPQQRRLLRRDATRPFRNILYLSVVLLVFLIFIRHEELGAEVETGPLGGAERSIGSKQIPTVPRQESYRQDKHVLNKKNQPGSDVLENEDNEFNAVEKTTESEPVIDHSNFDSTKQDKPTTPLEHLLSKYQREMDPKELPIDYTDVSLNEFAAQLVRNISPSASDPVEMSLLLMARRGHRTRVAHLIGGANVDWTTQRVALKDQAHVFAPFEKSVGVKSPRDLIAIPINLKESCPASIVPCRPGGGPADGVVSVTSMENVQCRDVNRPFTYCMSPQLSSDVPLLYISYHDFGVMKPVSNKLRPYIAAAYISNCGFAKRNTMVSNLVQFTNGRVRSYGGCVPSGHPEPSTPGVISRQDKKLAVLELNKFALAFENSESTDYVTEKFFGSLCSGSVPIVIGAPNIKFFAPDTTPFPYKSKALLHSADFEDNASKLANLLLALDANPAAYNEMLEWKQKGYSDDYRALVDIGDVHSSCRLCIATADDVRRRDGPSKFDVEGLKDVVDFSKHDFALFVRERGSYLYTRIGFKGAPTMKQLVRDALEHVPIVPKKLWKDNQDLRNKPTRVYAFYLARPARLLVLTDEELALLPNGTELEMIVV